MKAFVFSIVSFLVPAFVLAQDTNFEPIITALGSVRDIINVAIPIAVALAVLFFFWGLARYILASGDSAAREDGKHKMLWGVVALFVIVSIWGIVGFLGGLLGIGQGGTAPVPGVANEQGDVGENPSALETGR